MAGSHDASLDPHSSRNSALEIVVLRHQLAVLRRQIPRPRLEPADRVPLAAVSRVVPRARWSCFFVQPEMLLRWHRRLVAGASAYPHPRPADHHWTTVSSS